MGEEGEKNHDPERGFVVGAQQQWRFGNAQCFLGGGQYCATLEGTPDTVGVFTASLNALDDVAILGANAIP